MEVFWFCIPFSVCFVFCLQRVTGSKLSGGFKEIDFYPGLEKIGLELSFEEWNEIKINQEKTRNLKNSPKRENWENLGAVTILPCREERLQQRLEKSGEPNVGLFLEAYWRGDGG